MDNEISCEPNKLSGFKRPFWSSIRWWIPTPLPIPSYCYLWHSCGQIFSRLTLVFTGHPWKGREYGKRSWNHAHGCFISCILRSPRCISAASVDSGYASHYAGHFSRVTYPIVSLASQNCQDIASEEGKTIDSFILYTEEILLRKRWKRFFHIDTFVKISISTSNTGKR